MVADSERPFQRYGESEVGLNQISRVDKTRLSEPVVQEMRTPILLGGSGAQVVRVQWVDGSSCIEKFGPASEIAREAAVMRWCSDSLPVAHVLEERVGFLRMTHLSGVPLNAVALELASTTLSNALHRIHAAPSDGCPFAAGWDMRLFEAQERLYAGLIDESNFDEDNQGRSALDILKELQALPPPPKLHCFTHGDATLENFLTQNEQLSGMVDVGRAGVAHPAQDWALALRSIRDAFGMEGYYAFRPYIPPDCADEALLRHFCLLDELF